MVVKRCHRLRSSRRVIFPRHRGGTDPGTELDPRWRGRQCAVVLCGLAAHAFLLFGAVGDSIRE